MYYHIVNVHVYITSTCKLTYSPDCSQYLREVTSTGAITDPSPLL